MTESLEKTKTFSIGVIVGGLTRDSKSWEEHIVALMNDVKQAREGIASDLNLNVEFQVTGHLLAPDFEGVRTGAFRKKDSLLKIQVAVPAMASDSPRDDLIDFLWKAVDEAEAWTIRRKLKFDLTPLREIVARLES